MSERRLAKTSTALGIGLLSAVAGWGADWWLGPEARVGRVVGSGWPGPWPPMAGPALIVAITLALGVLRDSVTWADDFLLRRSAAKSGSAATTFGDRWPLWAITAVSFTVFATVILVAFIVVHSVPSLGFGERTTVPELLLNSARHAIAGGAILAGVYLVVELAERVMSLLPRWRTLRLISSLVTWFFVTLGFATAAWAILALSDMAAKAVGWPSPLTAGTFLGLIGPGVWVFASGVHSDMMRMEPSTPHAANEIGSALDGDFRRWQFAAEQSFQGLDAGRFPFFVWRESADDRLGFSRPRYCCVVEGDDDLLFQFFNPSKNVRSTGALGLAYLTGGGIMVWSLVNALFIGKPGDAFAGAIAGFLLAGFAAPLLGGVCYAAVTMWRWANGRFEGDGRLYSIPWRHLDGFQVVSAEDTGAERTERSPRGGFGLYATFGNKAPGIPLTANFWNQESIAEKHRLLTVEFIEKRGTLLRGWDEERKRRTGQDLPASDSAAVRADGVPHVL